MSEPAQDARPRTAGAQSLVLPNGMSIVCQTRTEARFLYEDIFEKEIYCRRGVSLAGVDCVFDVGANIGLFTLFVSRRRPSARIFSFEPAPPIFRILSANTGDLANVKRFNCGISNRRGTAELTFYANSSGMSSFYGDLEEEREALKAIMANQLRKGMEGMDEVMRHADDLLDERFRSETIVCELRTLSDVIREEGVERIDLLKIDVQKSEADVLAGIEDGDWGKIRQIVIEVHDIEGRLEQLTRLLADRGFQVDSEQDDHYETSALTNVFAVRPGMAQAEPTDGPRMPGVRDRMARLRQAVAQQNSSTGGQDG